MIAMEKLQIKGDSLDASNNAVRNEQSNESVSNMMQDIARSYKVAFTNGTNSFNKKSSVAAQMSNHNSMP